MSIVEYLRTLCQGEFAFWLSETERIVYYSEPHAVGSVLWPSEVCLIQALCQAKKDLYGGWITLEKKNRPQTVDTMGVGMLNHFRINLHDLATTQDSSPDAGEFKFEKLDASPVLARDQNLAAAYQFDPLNVDLQAQGSHLHRLYLAAAFRLIFITAPTIINLSSYKHARQGGHNIAAILAAKTGQVLAMALNTAADNKTFHAEVNALQAIAKVGYGFPGETFLYTTMKPCDMCAAMITQLLPDCTVIYGQDDPKAQGMIAPTGGMQLLSTLAGTKQLKLLDDHLNTTGQELVPELANTTQAQQQGKHQGEPLFYLTNVVDSKEVFALMEQAERNLERKIAKYSPERLRDIYGPSDYYGSAPGWNIHHPEILEVLVHLAPLLNLTYELAPPEIRWDRLREDGLFE